jgi:hypothetical protein
MESETEVLLVEIPCTSCGYTLNTLPVTGRCPECGTPVAESLRAVLIARSENGLLVAAFVRDGAWFNVLLLIGAAVGIMALFLGISTFLCFSLPALAVYAIFQSVAVLKVVAWPAKRRLRHRVIAISGTCFVALPLVFFIGTVFGRHVPGIWVLCVVLFPAIGFFTWAAGDQYADLCVTSELDGLRQWCRRMGRFNAGAVALMEMGFVLMQVDSLLPTASGAPMIAGLSVSAFFEIVSVVGGLALLLAGAAATAVVQFILARRLRHLAKKARTITLTGPAVPTPPSPVS